MRILHLIDSLNYGGAEALMMSYIPMMRAHEHLVITLNGPNNYPVNGYEYIQLDMHYRKDFLKIIRLLRQVIKKKKIEIVHSHSFWTNIISRFATPGGLRLFNHYHFADYETMKMQSKVKAMILMDRITGHKQLHRLGVSDYMGTILRKNFPGKLVTVIPNFISCSPGSLQKQITEKKFLKVVAIGNCNTEKNYEMVIQAFAELKDLPVSLEIFGGGDKLDYYRDKVKELELDNICFHGLVDGARKRLTNYDLFLSASLSESFGLAVLEAICARLPLLISDIPAFREIAPPSAVFFDPYNPHELASFIRKMMLEKPDTDQRNYDKVLEKYSPESFITHLDILYGLN